MTGHRWIEGLSDIFDAFDLFLIDQFGVLHDGVEAYGEALQCLTHLKANEKRVVLLSNSGKRAAANRARLRQFGFTHESFDHVVTSGEVAWQGIVDGTFGPPFTPGNRMFLVGHDDYDYGFEEIGLVTVEDPASADFIMIAASRAPKTSLEQHLDALAAAAADKIPALCCNPDRLMLTATGTHPSAGEIASLYGELGGRVTFVGKPYPEIYAAARKLYPDIGRARTLAIGDSLEHDIGGANRSNLPTALVLTGLSAKLRRDQLASEAARYDAAMDFALSGLRWGDAPRKAEAERAHPSGRP